MKEKGDVCGPGFLIVKRQPSPRTSSGIEISYDYITRFVDQLLCGISSVATGIDRITDHNLIFPGLNKRLPLGKTRLLPLMVTS